MTHAGKEPAEDVKRALVRAIKMAGLKVHQVRTFKGGVADRFVTGAANPADWKHECPAIEIHTIVDATGSVGAVKICCRASDEDPLMNVFVAPTVRDCFCELESLTEVLQAVWKERQAVMDRIQQGERPSRFVGRWVWEAPGEPPGAPAEGAPATL